MHLVGGIILQKLLWMGAIVIIIFLCGYFWYKMMGKEETFESIAPKETELMAASKPNQHQKFEEAAKPNKPKESLTNQEEMLATEVVSNPFQRGMNLLIYGHPQEQEVRKMVKHLSQLGVNSVAIVFPLFQEGWQANQVTTNVEMTPTKRELEMVILAAKQENLTVMLRPILDEQSIMSTGHWRGKILPNHIDSWFESYRLLIVDYAQLAEQVDVEMFNIGTEFNSLQKNKYATKWIQLINQIKEVYTGKLIYSFNWDAVSDIGESQFVPLLDYVGIDAYFPLEAPDQASVMMLEQAWEPWLKDIEELFFDKPVIITEAGIIPVKGAYRTPYAWEIPGGVYDPEAQANYYEATYRVWYPLTEGIYWWMVTLEPASAERIDFSPLRLPTKKVLKQLFEE